MNAAASGGGNSRSRRAVQIAQSVLLIDTGRGAWNKPHKIQSVPFSLRWLRRSKRFRLGCAETAEFMFWKRKMVRQQAGPVWAFPGTKPGQHKTRQAVWKDVKRAQRAFRFEQNVGPHSFRKVYAVHLMERYGNIERVRRALGHASPSVTAIYAMADTLLYRREHERNRLKRLSQLAASER
ncbi:MAG: tyrosine-type recombinase/integrase [Oscillibacter sp.]|nr:tyrosine-type recombinase/integrase [Oscillibacter sp.]MEA4992928.1 tyrosine-type recombinase/integrase [Oscillibacter sp.]